MIRIEIMSILLILSKKSAPGRASNLVKYLTFSSLAINNYYHNKIFLAMHESIQQFSLKTKLGDYDRLLMAL